MNDILTYLISIAQHTDEETLKPGASVFMKIWDFLCIFWDVLGCADPALMEESFINAFNCKL